MCLHAMLYGPGQRETILSNWFPFQIGVDVEKETRLSLS